MTLRLILTRHAKSSWGDSDLDDFDRVLNERGRLSATALGVWLCESGYVPQEVLCSAAARTRETWELIAQGLGTAPSLRLSHGLYHASAASMIAELRTAKASTVMMIGHNPGIGTLASRLVRSAPKHPKFGPYPTAATTIIDFDIDRWSEVERGECVGFVVPRDLLGTDDND